MLKPDDLGGRMEWRYAVKLFDPAKKISDPTWKALEQALVLTPSSYGLQPWKFFIVRDPGLRQQLRAASFQQKQVTDASHYVVFARRTIIDAAYIQHYLETMAKVRGIKRDTLAGFEKVMMGDVVAGPRSK